MFEGLFAVSLGAGMLAAVNPCGFALLPAYVSLLVGREDAGSAAAALRRALGLTLAMTAGFTLVFAAFGLLIAPVAAQVQDYLPYFTVVLGVVLALMGGWLVAGKQLKMPNLRRSTAPKQAAPLRRSALPMVGFGASYALASLSCTIGPFIAVVVGGFRSGSVIEGISLFAAYAAGMGLIVGALAVATALASHGAIARMRRAAAWAQRISGAVMLAAGAYVAYYGWWELRVLGGGETDDAVIDTARSIQEWLAAQVAAVGPGGWALVVALLVTITFGLRALKRGTSSGESPDEDRKPAEVTR